MKIYVATKFKNLVQARALMEKLISNGHTITYDWTLKSQSVGNGVPKSKEDLDRWQKFALLDAQGVLDADMLVVLTTQVGGRGVFTELGITIPSKKPAIIVGPHFNNIFYFMPHCIRVKNIDEAVQLINNY